MVVGVRVNALLEFVIPSYRCSKYDSGTNKIWLRWPFPVETTRQEERPTDTLLVPVFFDRRHCASIHLNDRCSIMIFTCCRGLPISENDIGFDK